jgi:hypothetical protein
VICFVCGGRTACSTTVWRNNGDVQFAVCTACRPYWLVVLPLLSWSRVYPTLRCTLCGCDLFELWYRVWLEVYRQPYVCELCLVDKVRGVVAKTALDARRLAEGA